MNHAAVAGGSGTAMLYLTAAGLPFRMTSAWLAGAGVIGGASGSRGANGALAGERALVFHLGERGKDVE